MNKMSNEKNIATLSIVRNMTNSCRRKFGINRTNLRILNSRKVPRVKCHIHKLQIFTLSTNILKLEKYEKFSNFKIFVDFKSFQIRIVNLWIFKISNFEFSIFCWNIWKYFGEYSSLY